MHCIIGHINYNNYSNYITRWALSKNNETLFLVRRTNSRSSRAYLPVSMRVVRFAHLRGVMRAGRNLEAISWISGSG